MFGSCFRTLVVDLFHLLFFFTAITACLCHRSPKTVSKLTVVFVVVGAQTAVSL